jgi:hypothetical protein
VPGLSEIADKELDPYVKQSVTQAIQSIQGAQNVSQRFPLDVLLISGHMHMGASTSAGLHKYLRRHPAVRSYGISSNEDQARKYIREGKVNSIFIDPCFPGEYFRDSEPFIATVRAQYPTIVFVLYTGSDCLERFCAVHPRFRHYFYLDQIWGFQEEATLYPKTSEVDAVLRRCEEWHSTRFQYDVGVSFAGEDRKYAEEIAGNLRQRGARIFYDTYEEAELLGKNLYTHLHSVYSEKCRYCVILISEAYARKVWTSHERVAAQQRALQEMEREYLIPVRVDDTELPGLSTLIGYVDINNGTDKMADLIAQKLWANPNAVKYYIGKSLY